MDWNKIWMDFFGTVKFLGLDMGFWVSLGVVVLIVIFMNLLFWTRKPKEKGEEKK